MLTLTFLGSGSGLVSPRENYHSNMIFTYNNKNLLIDCGSHFQMSMEELNFNVKDFEAVYISHLHADHVGGLEYLAFARYFGQYPFGSVKPTLFGHSKVLSKLWTNTLRGGLETLQGLKCKLSTFFNPVPIPDNGFFMWEGIKFELIQTVHIVCERTITHSYGLMIHFNNNRIFITGDSQCAPNQLLTFYEQATEIFQDCEIMKYPGSVHAQYHELNQFKPEIKNKMYLYHYKKIDPMPDSIREGFKGFVEKGQIFNYD